MEETDNQINNRPWLWKKGQSGNLKGRPKGKTLKEYAREYLSKMTDEERDEWLDGLNKETVWKMAEGLPQQDITSGGEKINPIPIINVHPNNSDKQNTESQQKDKNNTGGNLGQQDDQHINILDSLSSK